MADRTQHSNPIDLVTHVLRVNKLKNHFSSVKLDSHIYIEPRVPPHRFMASIQCIAYRPHTPEWTQIP